MKTLTVASAKGGSGKSTLVTALAVRALQESSKVALLDLNYDQGSLTAWHIVRPKLSGLHLDTTKGSVSERIKKLAASYDWAFVDTPPLDVELIDEAVAVADAVLIPVRCGFFDLATAQIVAEMCREHDRPFAYVLNAVVAQSKKLRQQMITALDRGGLGPRLKTEISAKTPWITALGTGRTGPEIDRALRSEIDALWTELKTLMPKETSQ